MALFGKSAAEQQAEEQAKRDIEIESEKVVQSILGEKWGEMSFGDNAELADAALPNIAQAHETFTRQGYDEFFSSDHDDFLSGYLANSIREVQARYDKDIADGRVKEDVARQDAMRSIAAVAGAYEEHRLREIEKTRKALDERSQVVLAKPKASGADRLADITEAQLKWGTMDRYEALAAAATYLKEGTPLSIFELDTMVNRLRQDGSDLLAKQVKAAIEARKVRDPVFQDTNARKLQIKLNALSRVGKDHALIMSGYEQGQMFQVPIHKLVDLDDGGKYMPFRRNADVRHAELKAAKPSKAPKKTESEHDAVRIPDYAQNGGTEQLIDYGARVNSYFEEAKAELAKHDAEWKAQIAAREAKYAARRAARGTYRSENE